MDLEGLVHHTAEAAIYAADPAGVGSQEFFDSAFPLSRGAVVAYWRMYKAKAN